MASKSAPMSSMSYFSSEPRSCSATAVLSAVLTAEGGESQHGVDGMTGVAFGLDHLLHVLGGDGFDVGGVSELGSVMMVAGLG